MNKPFTILIPDEPFYSTTNNKKKVNCIYTGPRYLLVSIDLSTNEIDHIASQRDTVEELNIDAYQEENHKFIVIDAEINPFEAAYLSNQYTNESVPDFVDKITNSYSWKYSYQENIGIFSDVFYGKLKYDFDSQKFIHPKFLQHPLTKDQYFESIKSSIESIGIALVENTYSPEQSEKIKTFQLELSKILDSYKNIDHWKIPYPITPSLAPDIPN
jgi:hypothetical protein